VDGDTPNLKEIELIGLYPANYIVLKGEFKCNVEESAGKPTLSSPNMGVVVKENKRKYMVMIRNSTMMGTRCTEGFTFK